MPTSRRPRLLLDEYRFPGFRPLPAVKGVFGEPGVRVISLVRKEKKHPADAVVGCNALGTTAKSGGFGTSPAAMVGSISTWRSGESSAGGVAP
jgi:hypothetical protein